jgi:hypothetical protein
MRHLVGILLAVVLAAAVFFAGSWGYLKLLVGPSALGTLPGGGGSLIHHTAVLEGFGALLGVGLVAGLLIALPRVSALASGLPGIVLLAWTGLYLFSVRRAIQYIPLKTHAYGMGFEVMLEGGVLALAGLAMIIPLFVPSRWRSAPATTVTAAFDESASTGTYPGLQETQTMAQGSDLMSDWAQTRPQPRANPGSSQAPWGPLDSGGSGGSV